MHRSTRASARKVGAIALRAPGDGGLHELGRAVLSAFERLDEARTAPAREVICRALAARIDALAALAARAGAPAELRQACHAVATAHAAWSAATRRRGRGDDPGPRPSMPAAAIDHASRRALLALVLALLWLAEEVRLAEHAPRARALD